MGRYLIYGGNGGIGEAIARRLATAGHDLVLAGRNDEELQALAGEIGAQTVTCDVTDDNAIATAAEAAGEILDRLVYAVGTINLKPFARLKGEDFLNDFNLNALGAAKAIQASLPALQKARDGASVLLFSTVAVDQGFAAHASIAMAKGAVVGLTRSLAAEFAPQIRVNAIAPSLVDSPLGKRVASNEKMAEAVAKMHPLPRLGRPDDIAAMGEILLTDAGSWITGQVIGIDGGRSTLRVARG
ncbi:MULTISPECIES: SDR family NAD(P)-dependent oxidoreductase [Aurantimonas]|uniref:SDR family NAD(P)-dependent oxidoreductase n=1 Tax=Aurantimonas TaxID=182269 RepID=UPI00351101B5